MHPRVAVSGLCFPKLSAVDALSLVADLGVSQTSIRFADLRESGAEAVADASRRHGVNVLAVTGPIGFNLSADAQLRAELERGREVIDLASAVGAACVYGLTGRRTSPEWNASLDAYVNSVGDLVAYSADRNITLAVEPANWLYADMTFVHTFHDALEVAFRSRMGVCFDIFHCWSESGLCEDITKHVDQITHVQLGDFVFGDRTLPSRAVPGEGDVPVAAVVRWLLEAGYEGAFDCELNGPRIDAIGHQEAARRGAAWLDALLVELGA